MQACEIGMEWNRITTEPIKILMITLNITIPQDRTTTGFLHNVTSEMEASQNLMMLDLL